MLFKNFTLTFFLLLCSVFLFAQNTVKKYTISGYAKDNQSGETLLGAAVFNKDNLTQGTITNAYGFFSLTLPEGKYTISISMVGYKTKDQEIDLTNDKALNFEMQEGILMQEVIISDKPKDQNVRSTEMGTVVLGIESIKKVPALMGEVDVLKALQLLPGVISSGEGNAGFYVRGGGADQNLVLLDEATVYNSGHLLGFFSVFNADAIKNTTLIKGGMPANYGSRLSSVVDIQMKEGNNQNFAATGGVGLIASRFTLEGPIQKNKSSFILSGRRTYALDIAQPLIDDTKFKGSNYYFYDFNAKANYRFSDKDRLYLSAYFGRDVFKFNSNEQGFSFLMPYGNATATLRLNHVFSSKLFANLSAIYNDYNFGLDGGQEQIKVKLVSGVRDINGKLDFDYFPVYNHSIKFGANYTFHRFTPQIATATNGEDAFSNNLQPKYAHENAIYALDEWKVNDKVTLNFGIRGSSFTQLGPYTSATDTNKTYKEFEPVKTYFGIEPRFNGTYRLDKTSSIKAGITVTNQYVHLVSNSTSTLPTDIWVPSTERIRPQQGIQYAVGYFRNFKDNTYETSVEVYYKDLKNQIDYPENYVQNAADDIEKSFVFGTGKAYGLELFLKKAKGRFNGWIGYTLSKTNRTFADINDGKPFNATFDRTHNIAVVMNYQLSRKWELNANFIYATGNTFTPLKSLYFIEQKLRINYGERNSARYQPYNRMDIGATYTPKPKSDKKFQSSWNFSVYNAYNRLNPFLIYYDIQTDFQRGTAKAQAYKVTLFPVIPSVTWNFKFRQPKVEQPNINF